ncbi:MAG: AIR synthase-related protein, partial [bacterium]
KIRFEQELPPWHREIVFDPQTSGGLLAAVPGEEADALLAALQSGGVPHAAMVGEVRPRERELLVIR